MRRTTMLKIPALLVIIFASQFALAQSQNDQTTSSTTAAKQVAGVRSKDTPGGTVVTITSDVLLSDYGAYRNGDTYRILIPAVSLALNNVHVEGTSFSDAKVEATGTNLVFSFRLNNGVSPSVSQRANQLEITFARLEVASTGAVSTRATALPRRDVSVPPDAAKTAITDATAKTTTGNSGNSTPSAGPAPSPTPEVNGFAGKNLDSINADLAVPESPAFTVLGVTPQTVSHPTIPREFATSLLNGVDERGNFQTGIALDFVPYLTFFGKDTSLFDYAKHPMEQFLARTQVSFATTKGVTAEDKSTRLALGLRMTIFDKGDPRLDGKLEECYRKTLANPEFETEEFVLTGDENDALKAQKLRKRGEFVGKVAATCEDEARKRNWNASAWIVGLAPSWISKTGATKDYVWNGGGFWSTIGYGFEHVKALENSSQILFHVRYRNNELVPDTDDPTLFFNQDSLYLGARVRIAPGDEAKSIFSFEGNYIRSRKAKGPWDNSRRFSLGFERRIAENIWFALSAGGQSGRSDGVNNAFVLSSFKWGFQQKKPTAQ